MKDLLIGAADNYNWSQIRNWAISIRESGFQGDVAILAYRVPREVLQYSQNLSIDVYEVSHDPFGQPIDHGAAGRDTDAHQMRFFHSWQLLAENENWKNYEFVFMTDIRDVIFQRDPSESIREWLQTTYDCRHKRLLAVSEGMTYAHEVWNSQNMLTGYGPFVHQQAQNWYCCNSGTDAGYSEDMMNMFLTVYNMTTRPTWFIRPKCL
jgi:hypothetical protein